MSEPVIWEITMPGKPTRQFIPLAFHKQLQAEVAALKSEVGQLRKAGDWMHNAIILNSDKDICQAMTAWTAARCGEGGDDTDFQEQQDIRLNR